MAYVDKTYYDSTYNGTTISDTDVFAQLLARAEDVINAFTNNDLYDSDTFDDLNTFQQTGVKKAVCSQIEFIYNLGGYNATNNSDNNDVGFSLSKFKIESSNESKKSNYQYFEGIPLSPSVSMYLKNTGLLYRGMSVIE